MVENCFLLMFKDFGFEFYFDFEWNVFVFL